MQSTDFIAHAFQVTFTSFFAVLVKLFFVTIFVLIVLFFAKRAIKYFQQTVTEHNAYEENAVSFSNIVGDVFFYGVLVFSACLGLYIAGFQSAYLILGATFASGYLFKELFQSVVSGVLIMTTKEFALGDLIEVYVDDIVHLGRIDLITIRYTVLRKLDMTRVVLPNRLLTRLPVMTFSAEQNVRLQTSFKLKASPDLYTHLPSIKKVIMSLESITEKDFTLITLDSMQDGVLMFSAYFYFDPNAGKLRFKVISEVNIALSEFFKEHAIVFAYPHELKTTDAKDLAIPKLLETYHRYA